MPGRLNKGKGTNPIEAFKAIEGRKTLLVEQSNINRQAIMANTINYRYEKIMFEESYFVRA